MLESELMEAVGLIARRHFLKQKKTKLSEGERSMLFYIQQRLEDLGIEVDTVPLRVA